MELGSFVVTETPNVQANAFTTGMDDDLEKGTQCP